MKEYLKDVENFIGEQDYWNPNLINLEKLFEPYEAAKAKYLKPLFGDKLIVSKEIAVSDEEYLFDEMGKLCRDSELIAAIERLEPSYSFSLRELVKNKSTVKYRFRHSSKPNTTLQFAEGTKIMKIISKVIDTFPEALPANAKEEFEEFRLKHSRILNRKERTDTLYLSIHPLDYITMSDNEENWSSCMSWFEEGDYHCGTVEMMNSPNVIVAYFSSNKHDYYSWNSKIWRKLYIVTEDYCVGIKGYPYQIESIDKEVFNFIAELRSGHYATNQIDIVSKGITQNLRNKDEQPLCMSWEASGHMYNDFNGNPRPIMYSEAFINRIENSEITNKNTEYCGVTSCMYCGRIGDSHEDFVADSHACNDCDGRVKCCMCGEIMFGGDHYFTGEDGNVLCYDCWHNEYSDYISCCHDCNGVQEYKYVDSQFLTEASLEDYSDRPYFTTIWLKCWGQIKICLDCYFKMRDMKLFESGYEISAENLKKFLNITPEKYPEGSYMRLIIQKASLWKGYSNY